MVRRCLYLFLIFSGFLVSNEIVQGEPVGAESAVATATAPGATVSSPTTPPPPAPASISASQSSSALKPAPVTDADANNSRKFYTVSVALREIYDSNIFTAKTNPVSSFETEVSPSILFDFPMENTKFSARETFTATYYSNRTGDPMDFSNEVVGTLQHSFSDRFSISAADQFRYYTQPSLFENVGTLYYSGAYIANTFNGSFNAQWTPLVSTLFTYSNTYVDYFSSATAAGNNSIENTGSGTLGFAILPKINLNFGGIVDNVAYTQIARGYTSLTGNTGINWQALPSLSVNLAIGASVTSTELSSSQTNATPYGAVGVNWQLGARSSLSFNYSHEVVPTDVTTAMGQVADRIGTTFHYDILPSLSAHLEGTYTHGEYTPWLISPNTISAYSENDFAIDAGLTYHVNRYFDVNIGNIYSGVASGLSFRDYNRDQVYLGVRGTY